MSCESPLSAAFLRFCDQTHAEPLDRDKFLQGNLLLRGGLSDEKSGKKRAHLDVRDAVALAVASLFWFLFHVPSPALPLPRHPPVGLSHLRARSLFLSAEDGRRRVARPFVVSVSCADARHEGKRRADGARAT